MSEPFVGSVEIISGNENRGVPGTSWTVEAVPVVVGAVAGITDLVSVEPEDRPSGRTPEAQWTGTDSNGFPVRIFLWKQQPEDLFPPPPPATEGRA